MTSRNRAPRHRTALTKRDLAVVAQVFGFTNMAEFEAFLGRVAPNDAPVSLCRGAAK